MTGAKVNSILTRDSASKFQQVNSKSKKNTTNHCCKIIFSIPAENYVNQSDIPHPTTSWTQPG